MPKATRAKRASAKRTAKRSAALGISDSESDVEIIEPEVVKETVASHNSPEIVNSASPKSTTELEPHDRDSDPDVAFIDEYESEDVSEDEIMEVSEDEESESEEIISPKRGRPSTASKKNSEARNSKSSSSDKQKKRRRSIGGIEIGVDLEDEMEEPDEQMGDYVDFSSLKLRDDHLRRPIWVLPDGRIFMEVFAPHYREVYDFLISIAHPLARTRLMHQYKINHGSLYAATSLGLETAHILKQLDRFSKTELPRTVIDYVTTYTERFGKATLVLKKGQYFVESHTLHVLQQLMSDPEIAKACKGNIEESVQDVGDADFAFPTEMDVEEVTRQMEAMRHAQLAKQEVKLEADMEVDSLVVENEMPKTRTIYSFEIDPAQFETVKRRCIEMDYPLLEEYDFANDTTCESVAISLKPTTVLRRYQEKCLSKLFSHGRVKSGIISLACGAGKSLVGVVASSTTKKKTLVLCTSTVSVQQWIHQFLLWSNVHHHNVVGFTSGGNQKNRIQTAADLGGVLVTTYNMLSHSNKRSGYSSQVVSLIEDTEWGMVILDEVHVVPANTFRSVISKVKSHCKLGLSATLVREDDLIEHLLYLIGPKLYEANWLDLCRAGHIANVCCAEVWCPMTAEFYREYVTAESRRGRALYIMNPNKLRTCEHLIRFHEARNDKILVFSDDVFALKTYAHLLGKPYIYGSTPNAERVQLLSAFQYNSNAKTLFISKIGDNSIDLPEATVLIQISSHYGSRRQEAQRLGRILRPKARTLSGRAFDAYFYSLVSQDTKESYYSAKRQQFLIEQGYAFKIFKPMHNKPGITVMDTKESQITLLRKVLAADIETLREMEDELDERRIEQLFDQLGNNATQEPNAPTSTQIAATSYSYTRVQTGSDLFSGAAGMEYDEIIDNLDS